MLSAKSQLILSTFLFNLKIIVLKGQDISPILEKAGEEEEYYCWKGQKRITGVRETGRWVKEQK